MALLLVGVFAAPAAAEEQPAILKAYGLDWIERVREEAWPQPKEQRPIICLLDTGVAVTPDTPEDNPLGPIVARLALDGGDGLPQGTAFEHLHGTKMASVIAAPRNGYGTVGVFPQARIVSIRVTEGADTFITPRAVALGANACTRWALLNGDTRVAAVVMAESNYDQRPVDVDPWRIAGRWVQNANALLIAAVGNSADADVVAPAAVDNTIAVGAGDDVGGLCSFSNYKITTALLGPGCSNDGAAPWPAGSSAATAAVGALIGAIVSRDPTLGFTDVKAFLESSLKKELPSDARVLSGAEAALLFGAHVSQRGASSTDVPKASPPPAVSSGTPEGNRVQVPEPEVSVRLWRPSVTVRLSRGRLIVTRRDHRAKGRIMVAFASGGSKTVSAGSVNGRKRVIRVKGRPTAVEVWITGGMSHPWRSLATRSRVSSK